MERFANYTGYGVKFKCIGPFIDNTPRYSRKIALAHFPSSENRIKRTIIAIDATSEGKRNQHAEKSFIRDLNKAYCGFRKSEVDQINEETGKIGSVATGNWGIALTRVTDRLRCFWRRLLYQGCPANVRVHFHVLIEKV